MQRGTWRQVLEHGPVGYLAVDERGRVVDVNAATRRLFGWRPDQVAHAPAGRPPQALTQRLAAAALQPGHVGVPMLLRSVDGVGRRIAAEATVWGVDRRGGTVVHALLRDVSHRSERAGTPDPLPALVERSADAVHTETLDGRVLSWNAAAESIFGWTADEIVGRDALLLVPDEWLEEAQARRASGTFVTGLECERLTRGGTRVWVSISTSPVHDEQGRQVMTATVARDITEQRWIAETLDATTTALQAALLEAQTSEERSHRFLADAAHQLRAPLAGIRASAETLLHGPAAADTERLLVSLVRETSRAARLLSSLLRIARLDASAPPAAGRSDVVAVCREEVERLALLEPGLKVSLVVDRPPGTRTVAADPASCREILSNLGENARRHADSRIEVVVGGDASAVTVRIRDDGPGVPEDEHERVFDRFVSLDGHGGSGLGLPIARTLARTLGGDLRYDDGFVLHLPCCAPPDSPAGRAGP
ncbi:MAG: domain S-box [Frankiales bacterium]|nr:domain S-box [Frankiales bacterium]